MTPLAIRRLLMLYLVAGCPAPSFALEPLPDKLVVLTFDDAVASQYTFVRPVLKRYGFGATFFISEGFSFKTNKEDYLTWAQIRELHDDGFEIGNHTRDHMGVSDQSLGQLREQVEAINARCAENGIPRPVSFAYPGNAITLGALPILRELGFRFARRGGAPEYAYEWGRGSAYEPGSDHPLLIPTAGDARPDWALEDFKRAADQARAGRVAVLQFHGVPDHEHPWVNTLPGRFEEYMLYLHSNGFHAIALRDLARYVDPSQTPADPMAVIERRKAERKEIPVEGEVRDSISGQPLAARLYVRGADGAWYFPKSGSLLGSAIRYERRNGSNTNALEMHTTLSAHPFRLELLPGKYTFTVERGKEYFPETREVLVGPGQPPITFRLRRWVNMAEAGWFSGDGHNHRNPVELPNVMLAEDVNVALPMVDWTTSSSVAPTDSRQGFSGDFGSRPIQVDATHVWQPRNTEYEIFQTGASNHILGAILILNHKTRFHQAAIPLSSVRDQARAEGALLDLEKHNWPWSMALVPLLNVDLFELANNHHWETEFAVRNWANPAPAWMGLTGSGTGTERDWTSYTFQTYYALLDCGFRLRPSAGTANGVHPVPLGFSRVYVHLDEPFSFDAWMRGLAAGRSFVTTGPMLVAKTDGQWPGATFQTGPGTKAFSLTCEAHSEGPLERLELIVNGRVAEAFTPQNRQTPTGSFGTEVTTTFKPTTTSWIAWRCFEGRPNDRFRFAHTGPSFFEVRGRPLRPRNEEITWLIESVRAEIVRSQTVAPPSLIEEYRQALKVYEAIAAEK